MAVVLDAIDRAAPAGGSPAQVIAAFFATRDRDSVLGRYSIDAHGDATLGAYGGYRVTPGGAVVFDRVLDGSPISRL
jgi:branched-chain amino acid transport system substrate-binding protein